MLHNTNTNGNVKGTGLERIQLKRYQNSLQRHLGEPQIVVESGEEGILLEDVL